MQKLQSIAVFAAKSTIQIERKEKINVPELVFVNTLGPGKNGRHFAHGTTNRIREWKLVHFDS